MCKCNLCKWGCYSCKKSFCGKKYGRLTHEHKNSECGTAGLLISNSPDSAQNNICPHYGQKLFCQEWYWKGNCGTLIKKGTNYVIYV